MLNGVLELFRVGPREEVLPAQILLARGKNVVFFLDRDAQALLLVKAVLTFIELADEEQVRELLNDGHGIGDTAGSKGIPNGVHAVFERAGNHREEISRLGRR